MMGRFKIGDVHQSVVQDLKSYPCVFELLVSHYLTDSSLCLYWGNTYHDPAAVLETLKETTSR
jgi:hypothetical protein